MKKLISFMVLIFSLSACSQIQTDQITNSKQQATAQNSTEFGKYQEIKTALTAKAFDESYYEEAVDKEVERLKELDQEFWYDFSPKSPSRMGMPHIFEFTECPNGKKENCKITGLTVDGQSIPKGLKTEKCEDSEFGSYRCLITDHTISPEFLQSLHSPQIFFDGKNFYTVDAPQIVDNYTIFKNEEIFFQHPMYYGTEGAVTEAVMVLDIPAFTFLEAKDYDEENKYEIIATNILYNRETLNEKYDLESTSQLFGFKDKVGLVAQKGGKTFLFFNGQKISGDFDKILTDGIFMSFAYPIEIDANGILFFMAKRGEEYYFVEVNLNEYL